MLTGLYSIVNYQKVIRGDSNVAYRLPITNDSGTIVCLLENQSGTINPFDFYYIAGRSKKFV
jgi:hypothetical protein